MRGGEQKDIFLCVWGGKGAKKFSRENFALCISQNLVYFPCSEHTVDGEEKYTHKMAMEEVVDLNNYATKKTCMTGNDDTYCKI